MKILLLYSIAIVACTILFTGCPGSTAGGTSFGDDDDPMMENGGCPFGFSPSVNGDCNCDAGKVNIADKECFVLPEGFYYTDMNNCLLSPGLAISFSDSLEEYDPRFNASYARFGYVDVFERQEEIHLVEDFYYIRRLSDGRDSIWFNLSSLVYTPRFEDWGRLYFSGVTSLTQPDEIEGVIVRGRGSDLELSPVQEVDRCSVVLRR